MTKRQVKTNINRLFKRHIEELEKEIDGILKDADMWYGSEDSIYSFNEHDRNSDLLTRDGVLDDELNIDKWLHTRKELIKRNVFDR